MNKIKLGDVMDVKRGTSLSGDYYSTSGDLVRLTLGNFKYPDCGFKLNTAKDDIYFVGEVKPEYIMKKGDIITPLTEQVKGLLGNTATIPESDKYIQSGDIGKIIPDESMIDKRFSYYLVSSPTVKKQLSAASQQTKIRHTSPDKIKDCVAFIPDLYQQKKIAHLLDTINLLIQTNDSTIEQLESLAKTIYDYWFLQLEFPNEDGKPYKSSGGKMVWNEELKREIPEVWSIKKLSDVVEVIDNRGKNPPTASSNTRFPIIDVATLRKRGRCISYIDIKNYVTEDVYQTWFRAGHPQRGDILFSTVGSLAETKLFYPNRCYDGVIAQNIVGFRNKEIYSYLYQMINSEKKQIIGYKIGSVQPSLKVGHVLEHKFLYPNNNILNKYCDMLEPINGYINKLNQENQELASLRDFLLPMLMNGQVTFKEDE